MSKSTATIWAAATVALGIVLVGCTPATSAPTSSSSPSTEPETSTPPSPTPTEEPVVVDPEDPTTWLIEDTGVGPIEIGAGLVETLAELPSSWTNDADNCSWTAWWTAPDTSYGMNFVRGTESDDAPIREISVYTAAETVAVVPGPLTTEGLGIGATKAEVTAAYPGAVEGTPEIGGGSWLELPGDGDAHVFFQFRDGQDAASSVTVTVGDAPSYEVCG